MRGNSVVPWERIRIHGHKLKDKKIHVNVRKHIFMVRVVKHLSSLLREVMNSASLEILKTHPASVLGSWLRVVLPGQGVGLDDLLRSCQPRFTDTGGTREGMLSPK